VAEPDVHTFRNQVIANLATINHDFPIQLQCRLLPHVTITLNMLQSLRINPNLSAYKQVNGIFNSNAMPLAYPGPRGNRQSWHIWTKSVVRRRARLTINQNNDTNGSISNSGYRSTFSKSSISNSRHR
jgi:hypothetical protein